MWSYDLRRHWYISVVNCQSVRYFSFTTSASKIFQFNIDTLRVTFRYLRTHGQAPSLLHSSLAMTKFDASLQPLIPQKPKPDLSTISPVYQEVHRIRISTPCKIVLRLLRLQTKQKNWEVMSLTPTCCMLGNVLPWVFLMNHLADIVIQIPQVNQHLLSLLLRFRVKVIVFHSMLLPFAHFD